MQVSSLGQVVSTRLAGPPTCFADTDRRSFRMLVTSESTGLIETITDAVSVHSIKKDAYSRLAQSDKPLTTFTLYDHFMNQFGDSTTSTFRRAQDHFMKSLASYSIICYLLQIKDRHNGNILIDKQGRIVRASH